MSEQLELFRPTDNPEDPYDPRCETFASDMEYLDSYLYEDQTRVSYILEEEGTFNDRNGHFLCDSCYIQEGSPSSPRGWICP